MARRGRGRPESMPRLGRLLLALSEITCLLEARNFENPVAQLYRGKATYVKSPRTKAQALQKSSIPRVRIFPGPAMTAFFDPADPPSVLQPKPFCRENEKEGKEVARRKRPRRRSLQRLHVPRTDRNHTMRLLVRGSHRPLSCDRHLVRGSTLQPCKQRQFCVVALITVTAHA